MSVFRIIKIPFTRMYFANKIHHIRKFSVIGVSESNMLLPSSLYGEEHFEMQNSVKRIIDSDINPFIDEWEAKGQYPAKEVMKIFGRAGLLGVNRPIDCGGLNLDYSYNTAFAEALGDANCGAIPMSIGVQTDMATPALSKYGNATIKEEFLKPSISGDKVACLGVSEPSAGSDVSNIKTTAIKDGDDYVINGSKMWITNAFQADWMCLLANTEGGSPPFFNKTLICLPMNTPGIHLAKRINKMGMLCSDTAQIYFQDVRVPQEYRIGEENKGFIYQMEQFQEERIFAAAACIVPLQKCIDITAEYTKNRKLFGNPLLNNQVVHFKLGELATEVEALKSLVYRTVGLYIEGHNVVKLASMCKLKSGRLAREVTDSCLQFWGGMGYTTETLINRYYRDFRLLSIGGGADEVMLNIICKELSLLPKKSSKQK